jgi:hypothetical protein
MAGSATTAMKGPKEPTSTISKRDANNMAIVMGISRRRSCLVNRDIRFKIGAINKPYDPD